MRREERAARLTNLSATTKFFPKWDVAKVEALIAAIDDRVRLLDKGNGTTTGGFRSHVLSRAIWPLEDLTKILKGMILAAPASGLPSRILSDVVRDLAQLSLVAEQLANGRKKPAALKMFKRVLFRISNKKFHLGCALQHWHVEQGKGNSEATDVVGNGGVHGKVGEDSDKTEAQEAIALIFEDEYEKVSPLTFWYRRFFLLIIPTSSGLLGSVWMRNGLMSCRRISY